MSRPPGALGALGAAAVLAACALASASVAPVSQEPDPPVIAIHVVDADTGEPLAGSMWSVSLADWEVEVSEDGLCDPTISRGELDAEGRGLQEVPLGKALRIGVQAGGLGRSSWMEYLPPMEPGQRLERSVEVRSRWTVFRCRALADESGEDLAVTSVRDLAEGAPAAIGPDERVTLKPLGIAVEEGTGRFTVTAPDWEWNRLEVRAEGREPVILELPGPTCNGEGVYEVRMRRAATLEARVLDPEGRPVAGVEVKLELALVWLDDTTWSGVTDEEGRATIPGLRPDDLLAIEVPLNRLRDDWRTLHSWVRLDPGERREVVLQPGREVLRGRAVDEEGRLVQELGLTLTAPDVSDGLDQARFVLAEARTGSQGEFEFPSVPPGRWRIVPRPWSEDEREFWSWPASWGTLVDVPIEGREAVSILAEQGMTVRGRIRLPDGSPAILSSVLAFRTDRSGRHESETDHEGRFLLGPLVPGDYEILAASLGGWIGSGERVRICIDGGAAPELELAHRPAGILTGRPHLRDGGAPLEVEVFAAAPVDVSFDPARVAFGVTLGGQFLLEAVLPGRVHLFAYSKDGMCGGLRDVEVEAGKWTRGLRVDLHPGARLLLQGPRSGAAKVLVRSGDVLLFADELSARERRTLVVPPGDLEVLRLEPGLSRTLGENWRTIPVKVAAGELARVDLGD